MVFCKTLKPTKSKIKGDTKMNISKFKNIISNEITDTKILLRSVPSVVMVFFVISVVLMNLLANKELLNYGWIALDCGFVVSWISFLAMDMLTKRFGPKAAIKLSITAILINLLFSGLLYLISCVPGNWGQFYTYNDSVVNEVLDATIGGTWYVVLGSMTAFGVASVVNAILNAGIGKLTKSTSFASFALRSYVSTGLGQFVDNLIFALLVSHVFFGWTMFQVFTCSLAGACMELLSEVIFSPIGYRACKKWETENVGNEYLDYLESRAHGSDVLP